MGFDPGVLTIAYGLPQAGMYMCPGLEAFKGVLKEILDSAPRPGYIQGLSSAKCCPPMSRRVSCEP